MLEGPNTCGCSFGRRFGVLRELVPGLSISRIFEKRRHCCDDDDDDNGAKAT